MGRPDLVGDTLSLVPTEFFIHKCNSNGCVNELKKNVA